MSIAAMQWDSPNLDFSVNASLGECTTPSFQLTYPMASTPLILPRDWPEIYDPPTNADFGDYDFQSNHLESAAARPPSGLHFLAGLGIRNVDLAKDLELAGCDSSIYVLHDHQSCRPSQRTYRTDSIYDTCKERKGEIEIFDQTAGDISVLNSSWSFSSILKAAELVANNPDTETHSSFSSGLNLGGDTSTSVADAEDDIAWSFETLSAATGLSMADFAAQISVTAEATLQRMAADDLNELSFDYIPSDGQARFTDSLLQYNIAAAWPPLSHTTPELALPLVDTNMREFSWNNICEGVNPADILPPLSSQSPPVLTIAPGRIFLFQPTDNSLSSDSLNQNISANIGNFALNLDQSVLGTDSVPSYPTPYSLPRPESSSRNAQHASEDEPSLFQSPSSSEYSPALRPLSQKRNLSSRISSRRVTRSRIVDDPDTTSPEYQNDCDRHALLPVNLGTPVLDAHRGIELEVLKAKAERYRLRNQGHDYDKRWLISFAGKLSARGELVEEFRCYVTGCKQTNKRRDHILIHVGAHLDQRPFKCMHCSSRFLRKNECKRHELSHTGIRPFSCHLCPYPTTTFVRQDLLKRHMKRTHRLDTKVDKENEDVYRPKKRARH